MMSAALTLLDGNYTWRGGDDAQVSRPIDGTEIKSSGFSLINVVRLATPTGAKDVEFGLATGVS